MSQLNAPAPIDINLRTEVFCEDAESVHQLVRTTGFFSEEEVAIAAELVQSRLADGESSGYYFIFAEIDRQLAGYVCYGPIPGTQGSFDIYWIIVHPSQQNRGLGRTLINACEQSILSMDGRRVYVETAGREQYAPTHAFYQRLGYIQAAFLPEFYAPGDAKIIYEKALV